MKRSLILALLILSLPLWTPRGEWTAQAAADSRKAASPSTKADRKMPRNRRRVAPVVGHLGGLGLFGVALLDSSPIPTFGGLDILTAVLAARHAEPWLYYALIATAGSVIGAYITFKTARKAGASYLERRFGKRKVSKLLDQFQKWGTGALVVSAAIPFPFPTSFFFAAAGVLDYSLGKFIAVVAVCRGIRYATIALVASLYGRNFVRALRNPGHYYGWMIAIGIVLVLVVTLTLLLRKRSRLQPEAGRPLTE
jgi:membrane protein YqaA with SNARE-associated domain